jgi:ABC-type Na+ efflux pump permease subunit
VKKILVIARREYQAAVRSKAFIITLVMMPLLMGGSIGIQALFQKLEEQKPRRFAVIDRTGGGLARSLEEQAALYNALLDANPDLGRQLGPKFTLEAVAPGGDSAGEIGRQRYDLSQRVEKGAIDGVLEIGPDVLKAAALPGADPEKASDREAIRFQTKNPTLGVTFRRWAELAVNEAVQVHRLSAQGIDAKKVKEVQALRVPLKTRALTHFNPETGRYEEASVGTQVVNFLLPGVLIALMFMVVMIGATPAMQGIVEEKGQRIAEVLLGSVTPFQLMAGKLLGLIGVSLTMAAVYLGGGYVVALRYGVAGALTPVLLLWFVLFLVLALLIYGSLFLAVGAAASDIKDTQTLLMPLMVVAVLPMLALGPILQEPNGRIAVVCSFIPFATPMLLVARESVPPGVPLWQMATGIVLVLATTLFCVWAAGRVFRVGLLMQGKGARFSDMIRWVVRG